MHESIDTQGRSRTEHGNEEGGGRRAEPAPQREPVLFSFDRERLLPWSQRVAALLRERPTPAPHPDFLTYPPGPDRETPIDDADAGVAGGTRAVEWDPGEGDADRIVRAVLTLAQMPGGIIHGPSGYRLGYLTHARAAAHCFTLDVCDAVEDPVEAVMAVVAGTEPRRGDLGPDTGPESGSGLGLGPDAVPDAHVDAVDQVAGSFRAMMARAGREHRRFASRLRLTGPWTTDARLPFEAVLSWADAAGLDLGEDSPVTGAVAVRAVIAAACADANTMIASFDNVARERAHHRTRAQSYREPDGWDEPDPAPQWMVDSIGPGRAQAHWAAMQSLRTMLQRQLISTGSLPADGETTSWVHGKARAWRNGMVEIELHVDPS